MQYEHRVGDEIYAYHEASLDFTGILNRAFDWFWSTGEALFLICAMVGGVCLIGMLAYVLTGQIMSV